MRLHRQRTQAAAHQHAEAALAVADHGAQTDVVDRAQHAIFLAARKGDLEFARHAVGQFLVQERERDFLRVRMHVENFVGQQPAQRTSGDVADRVVAGFARSQAEIRQPVQQVGATSRQRNEMILDVLASGEVSFAAAELVGDGGQLIHLRRGHRSARDLGADHVHAGLPLAVYAAAQALGAELVVGEPAGHVLLGVGTEQLDVGSNRGVVLRFGLVLGG